MYSFFIDLFLTFHIAGSRTKSIFFILCFFISHQVPMATENEHEIFKAITNYHDFLRAVSLLI